MPLWCVEVDQVVNAREVQHMTELGWTYIGKELFHTNHVTSSNLPETYHSHTPYHFNKPLFHISLRVMLMSKSIPGGLS